MSISRRQFIAGAGAAGAAGALGIGVAERGPLSRLVGLGSSGSTSSAKSTGKANLDPAKGILVLVTLYGGNDGLNTVVPASDGAYRSARGDLALDEHKVLPLADGLSLAPELTGLKRLWDDGHLGIVQGVGYPEPNRSHFRSMDIWQTGVPDRAVTAGWLGRWLDATGEDPLRALATTTTLPRVLLGDKVAGSAVPAGQIKVPIQGPTLDAYRALEAQAAGDSPLRGRAAEAGGDLLGVADTVAKALAAADATGKPATGAAPLDNGTPTTDPGGKGNAGAKQAVGKANAKTAGSLDGQLDTAARLIKAGLPTRVYAASMGGFDTHVNEGPTHPRLMADLDKGISTFFSTLGNDPRTDHVVVVVYSEFGRRVAADANGGTDHGTAGPVLVAGRSVVSGFHGTQPSLTDLDDGDLKAGIDFRSIYTTLLGDVLGVDPKISLDRPMPGLRLV